MPDIITIIFDCFASSEPSLYSSTSDDIDKCVDAQNALYDFLRDNHISWYERSVTRDELHDEEIWLESTGAGEYE